MNIQLLHRRKTQFPPLLKCLNFPSAQHPEKCITTCTLWVKLMYIWNCSFSMKYHFLIMKYSIFISNEKGPIGYSYETVITQNNFSRYQFHSEIIPKV